MGEHKHKSNGATQPKSNEEPLDCYRVIVCSRGICDRETNLTTYVDVQEDVTLPKAVFGRHIPMQGHFGIVGTGTYEIRVVWANEEGVVKPAGDTHDRITIAGRQRFAAMTLAMPPDPGFWSLTLEWRHVGDLSWNPTLARCPIVFTLRSDASKGESPLVRP